MKILTLILYTVLLTSCASYQFGDATKLAVGVAVEVGEINHNNRQHKCNMDITQCEKYGLKQDD